MKVRQDSYQVSTFLTIVLTAVLFPIVSAHAANGETETTESMLPQTAAGNVLERLIPQHVHQFVLETIPQDKGCDVFEIESRGKKIVLRGSNGVSICSALNWYLKYHCQAHVSWNGSQLHLPESLPVVKEKIRRVSPHKYRYFFNYCCFGYSLAWWDWSQWERIIDWMALNGINMPLAVTGQEATWPVLLHELGIGDKEISNFIAGPPYLPFGWMGCLDGWGGPLPQNWIDRHRDLQKKILARERELGMTPVLQGFTGHVPAAIREKYPESTLQKIHWSDWDTYFLDPQDPLFRRIGKAFLETQARDYGSDHLYAADTFIEMSPPSSDPAFLDSMGKAISGAMTAADPKAVWVMQGWIFFNNKKFWQPPQAKAFLTSVPDDRMILLDLYCDQNPVWNQTQAFYGKPWIWCILQNFGNTVQLSGPLARINQDLHAARTSPARGKLSGIGMIQEGLGYNPIVFDFMTEMTWRHQPADLDEWVSRYTHRRYGRDLPQAKRAWELLQNTVYSVSSRQGSMIWRRPALSDNVSSEINEQNIKLMQTWNLLLQCAGEIGQTDTYRFDLVNVARQVLSNLSVPRYAEIITAYHEKDYKRLVSASDEYLQLIRDLDELLAAREEFLLGKWLEDAKRWGTNNEEKRLYEWNARNVITLWGGREAGLHDYARKEWSGLISGFYLQRWQMFLNRLERSLAEKKPFNNIEFTRDIQLWEEDWTHQTETYPAIPQGDAIALARKFFEKYCRKYTDK